MRGVPSASRVVIRKVPEGVIVNEPKVSPWGMVMLPWSMAEGLRMKV